MFNALAKNRKKNKGDENNETNVEEKIDNGILFCCMMFFIGFVNSFFWFDEVIVFNNRKFDTVLRYLILYVCVFLSYNALKKHRPRMKDVTKGWMVFYKFILSQLDIEKAFRRNK